MSASVISRIAIYDGGQYDKKEARLMEVSDKFKGKPQLFAWLTSPEYKEIGKYRDAGSTAEAIIVNGLEPGDVRGT